MIAARRAKRGLETRLQWTSKLSKGSLGASERFHQFMQGAERPPGAPISTTSASIGLGALRSHFTRIPSPSATEFKPGAVQAQHPSPTAAPYQPLVSQGAALWGGDALVRLGQESCQAIRDGNDWWPMTFWMGVDTMIKDRKLDPVSQTFF